MFVVFTSCNKNQTAVRKLDGKWQATEFTTSNGTSSTTTTFTSDNAQSYTFNNCKLKKNEYCNVTITQFIFGFGISLNQQYRVIDDGKTLEIKNGSFNSKMTIVDLKGKDLTLQTITGSSNTSTKFKKVD